MVTRKVFKICNQTKPYNFILFENIIHYIEREHANAHENIYIQSFGRVSHTQHNVVKLIIHIHFKVRVRTVIAV